MEFGDVLAGEGAGGLEEEGVGDSGGGVEEGEREVGVETGGEGLWEW